MSIGHCPSVQKKSPGAPRALPLERRLTGIALAEQSSWSVGAAVTAAEERPEPIVQTNFEHLNLTARGESVSPERPRSKREVIQFEKVILKLRRPISRYRPFDASSNHPATIPIGCADRGTGVEVRNGGMIVDPPALP